MVLMEKMFLMEKDWFLNVFNGKIMVLMEKLMFLKMFFHFRVTGLVA